MSQQSKFNGASSRSKRLLDLALKQQNKDPHPPPKRTKRLPKKEMHDTENNYLSLYDSGKWDDLDMILNSYKNLRPPNSKDQPKGSIVRPLNEYHYCITNTPPLNLKDFRSDLMQDKPPVFTEDPQLDIIENTHPCFTEDPQSDIIENTHPCFTEDPQSHIIDNPHPCFTEDPQSDIIENTHPSFTDDSQSDIIENTHPCFIEDPQSDIIENSHPCFTEDPQSDIIENTHPCFTEDPQSDIIENTHPCFTEDPQSDIIENTHPCFTEDPQSDIIENTHPCFTEDPQSDIIENTHPCFTEDPQSHIIENTHPCFTEDPQSDIIENTHPCFTEDPQSDIIENTHPCFTEDPQSDIIENTHPCFTEDPQSDIIENTHPCFTEDPQSDIIENTHPCFTEDPQSHIIENTNPCFTEDPQSDIIENTHPSFTDDSQSDIIENTHPCFIEDPQSDIIENSHPCFTEDPQSDIIENTHPCFTEDPQSDIIENTHPCFTEDPQSDIIENTHPCFTEDPQSDIIENTHPCFTEDPQSDIIENAHPCFTEDPQSDIIENTHPCFTEDPQSDIIENTHPCFTEDPQSDIIENTHPCFTEDPQSDIIDNTHPCFTEDPQSDIIENTHPGFAQVTPPSVTEDTVSDFKKDSSSDKSGDPYSTLISDQPLNSYLLVVPPDSNSQNVNAYSTTSPIDIICDPDIILLTPDNISGGTENTVISTSNSKLENSLKCSRRSLFSTNTQTDKTSKKRIRREDRRNYCVFCEKLVLNFRRHAINNHQNESIIAEYIALFETCPNESKEKRNKMLESLRLKGNHLYNQSLLNQSPAVTVDQILPVKRPPKGKIVTSSDFVTCTLCHGLFLRKHFFQHANLCKRTTEEKELSTQHEDPINNNLECNDFLTPQDQFIMNRRKSTFLKEYGLTYCPKSKDTTPLMEENIFKNLNKDDIGIKAMSDSLLVDVVTDYYSSHKAYKDRNQVARKLRDGSKLVHEVNTIDNEVKELKDIFNPNKIHVVIEACKKMCNLDDQNLNYENCLQKNVIVGMNGRLSWVLEEGGKRLVDNIVCDISLTDEEKEIKKRKVINFQECLRRRWKYCISTNIEIARRRLKIFKDTVMPLDEDIVKFASMLRQMEVEYQFKLQNEVTIESYEMLCKVTICHILTLNRRRPFEATHSDISFYLKKKDDRDYYSPNVLKSFADEEKVSMNELKSYIVPAKGNEEIATILLTKSMEKSIDSIISCRKYLQLETNKYLFARPGLNTPFDGSAVMREMKSLCPNLKKPQHLTATGLRHQVATVGHVKGPIFSSKLSKFMCHTQSVHDKNYVAPLSIVHRGVIGSYLAGLEGTPLSDLQHQTVTKDITNGKSTLQQTSLEHHNTPYTNTTTEEEEIDDPSFIPEEENSSEDENCYIAEAGKKKVNVLNENKTRRGVVNAIKDRKKRWSEEDKLLVVQYFGNFIKKGKNPGTIKCREFLEKSNMLPGRTPAQVNTFIDNVNKNKLKLSQSILNVLKT